MSGILEVKNLSVSYGIVPALKEISFHVDEGETVALIGPNGAGKTTTMHTISGLLKPVGGEILYCGKNIVGTEAHRLVTDGISQVPEGRGIFPTLTVAENIDIGAFIRNDKEGIKKDKEWVYSLFPRLKERMKQISGTLSGGELQMLAMARALMANPKLLLLDEPSMGLAPVIVEDVFHIIRQINKEQHTTILLVEQNAQMALTAAKRAYIIEVGQIVREGLAKDLMRDDEIRKSYLGL
ncbi:MAG: ABC transporter ATP-binding protein [Lachnospiraceae bacterium]|nr:ABC transporter ATP-binding protein [Lachnospiraceae bacterium]